MKTSIYSVAVVALVVGGVMAFNYYRKPDLCYVMQTQVVNRIKLSMNLGGEKVLGELGWFGRQDHKVGKFQGKIVEYPLDSSKRKIEAEWFPFESDSRIEQVFFLFNDTEANIAVNEDMDYTNEGVFYKNPDKLNYNWSLQAIDCDNFSMN